VSPDVAGGKREPVNPKEGRYGIGNRLRACQVLGHKSLNVGELSPIAERPTTEGTMSDRSEAPPKG
jgi:hypothetical protein